MEIFAVLLPITSRGCTEEDLKQNITTFLDSLVSHHDYSTMGLCLYVGVDVGDPFFAPWKGFDQEQITDTTSSKGLKLITELVHEHESLCMKVFQYATTKGNVCYIWRSLARLAWQDGCDFFALFGDDVTIHTKGWAAEVRKSFSRMVESSGETLPFGFGCVALCDNTFPYFPSFPVVHKTHIDAFGGEIFPPIFYNQDADPYLFELYKRWNASVFSDVRLTNKIGGNGEVETRYEKQHATDWTHEPVAEGVRRLGEYLVAKGFSDKRYVVMDVVVPTLRCGLPKLSNIVSLRSDATVTTFIIIVDYPDPHSTEVMAILSHFAQLPRTQARVVVNGKNNGAAFTRTMGIYESWADYILFLDDDVVPEGNILSAYAQAIKANPNTPGFVGMSIIPEPQEKEYFRMAVKLCYITDWWTIAQREPNPPWGITANLVTRRYKGLYFDHTFTGGEDIDFCLRLRERGPLLSVPDAIIHHDWWKSANETDYGHFAHWAHGDGRLLDVHGRHTYRDVLDAVETMTLLCIALFFALLAGYSSLASSCLLTVACVWITEAFMFLWCHSDDVRLNFHIRPWSEKLIITKHAVLLTFAVQLGRIRGHWDRNGIWLHYLTYILVFVPIKAG